jgi:hypothetical protein
LYNGKNKPHHISVGLKITADRIALFNGPGESGEPVRFTDLYDPEGNPAGTRVEINIKAS